MSCYPAQARRWGVVGLLGLHASLLGYSAERHSPTWDEVAHLPAAISYWQFQRFDVYCVNPPLIRLVASLPVVWSQPRCEWMSYSDRPEVRSEFLIGADFARKNGQKSFWYFTIARWACIPFSLLGAWVCFCWASELYGQSAGIVALAMWCFCPNILGHGQLITPDVGATSFGVLASYLFWRWLKCPDWSLALAAGVGLGVVELTKFTWIVLFPLWPVLWVFWSWCSPLAPRVTTSRVGFAHHWWAKPTLLLKSQGAQLAAILVLALCVINLGYGFEGSFTPLGDYRFVSARLRGMDDEQREVATSGNRFTGTLLGTIPVPVPRNYLQGIDVQKVDFEKKSWSYLRGEWRFGGWWYYYLYGLLIKVPLGTWCLIVLALFCRLRPAATNSLPPEGTNAARCAATWGDDVVLLAPAAVVLTLVSSQTGFNHHLRYVLPIFPLVFIWASRATVVFQYKYRTLSALAAGALCWSIGSSLWFYPHGLSYFNELAGGPKGGHAHLLQSNTDWGQDLLYLKRWLDEHPEASPLGLAYEMPLIDPRIAEIEYTRPPIGPDASALARLPSDRIGPLPGWYAISVNKLRGREKRYAYFLRFEPIATAGYSIYIYHISLEEANRVRRELGLNELDGSELSDAESGGEP